MIHVGRRRHFFPWKSLCLYISAFAVVAYLLAPFSWLVLTSFMKESEAISVPPHWIPREPTLSNYRSFVWPEPFRATQGGHAPAHLADYLRNSFVVAVTVTVLNMALGSITAYPLARMQFKGAAWLMLFYLASRMVPAVAIIVPLFLVMQTLGLLDNILSLIVAYTSFTLPFTIWILRSYFQTIPRDLEDAARVDRCNRLNMILRVFLPVAVPALVAAGMFSFMACWSEFLYAVIFTSTEASKTITVAVASLATGYGVEKTLMAAGGVLAVVPPLILALIFQRLIVGGLVSGSIKG